MKEEILRLDARDQIVQLNTEIEETSSEIEADKSRIAPMPKEEGYSNQYTDRSCYLCGGYNNSETWRVPFDEFIRRVVYELEFGIHMVLCLHEDSDECLEIQEEDSCHFLDYCPSKMSAESKRKRSLRRHVAYKLWHDGILRTPSASQEWATALS